LTALSCVSTPILPRQQCHLAFISEFNVQMVDLPHLKNVIADFLSHLTLPHRSHLALSSPRQRWTQLTSNPWPTSKTAVWKCSVCSVVHPSNLLSGWRCFHGSFLSHCPSKILKRHYFAFAQHFPPWEAGLSVPCVF
jgi:hypothetical protein